MSISSGSEILGRVYEQKEPYKKLRSYRARSERDAHHLVSVTEWEDAGGKMKKKGIEAKEVKCTFLTRVKCTFLSVANISDPGMAESGSASHLLAPVSTISPGRIARLTSHLMMFARVFA